MKKISIVSVNFSDSRGGAAIAARQQVSTIREIDALNVDFIVAEKNKDDDFSRGPSGIQYAYHFVMRIISLIASYILRSDKKVKNSHNIFSSSFIKNEIISSDADIIHFHWLNNDTLSINAICEVLDRKKTSKFIFTLHDDWFFCNTEHYAGIENNDEEYIHGYHFSKYSLHNFTYLRKLNLIPLIKKDNVVFTAPSRYLVDKAKKSYLLKNADVICIPNIIDTDIFQPTASNIKQELSIPDNSYILLFGAIKGASYLKGGDLLMNALSYLSDNNRFNKEVVIITFGSKNQEETSLFGFKIYNLGHIKCKKKLSSLYSAADITIVPSRLEAFGQVAAESLSCQTPVIGFDNSGLHDIVQHDVTGYLAPPFDTNMIAQYIEHFFQLPESKRNEMGVEGRKSVIKNFSVKTLKKQWLNTYKEIKK
ncbi:glycosyltransferase [Vibrio fluvialis]|uniref:glycosyltransferase n=1 Tax=Vibrio fluvialis TaxID=676 RepID=UPI0028F71FF6|nr:glycosyltransferase [Vibrio fluvialis]